MNNNYLNNLINLYGGNENPNEYTQSLLNKYKNNNDIVIIKLNNLESLLHDDDNDDDDDDMFNFFNNNNNIIEIDNQDQDIEHSETFSEIVSKIIK